MRKKIHYQVLFTMAAVLFSRADGSTRTVSTAEEVTSAISSAVAGDTILVRAGTYAFSSTINISGSGSADKRCVLMAHPGDERPLFDLNGSTGQGSKLNGSYWHIKGIRITNAANNGLHIKGSGNIVEYCDFFENGNTGCQIEGGASDNCILNCDSYYNTDEDQEDADGFAPKMDVGTGNVFRGCRAWQNSDDGYDGYLRPVDDVTTTYENCWCFKNGYLKDGSPSSGNGNGFKMGGSDDKNLRHNAILKNCLAVGNRVKGFDQNNNRGSMTLCNCTACNNGTNYKIDASILSGGKSLVVTNCISAGSGAVSLKGGTITTCSWSSGFSVSNGDFISMDQDQLTETRKNDGSLPDILFMHLTPGSSLIDAGTVIDGMQYGGEKPDLGCFETDLPTGSVRSERRQVRTSGGTDMSMTGTVYGRLRTHGILNSMEFFNMAGRKIAYPAYGEQAIDIGHSACGIYIRGTFQRK